MKQLLRYLQYFAGLIILALGITLNTKTGLGVSPIISVPYSISQIWHVNFGYATLVLYCLFIAAQFLIKGKKRRAADLLQLPLSIVFSIFLNLLNNTLTFSFHTLGINLLILLFAIICTGVGVSLSVNSNLVVNPGDGIVQAIAMRTGAQLGFTKNIFDLFCIIVTLIIGFAFTGNVIGIGIGTVAAVIGVGRVVALTNYIMRGNYNKTGQIPCVVSEEE